MGLTDDVVVAPPGQKQPERLEPGLALVEVVAGDLPGARAARSDGVGPVVDGVDRE